MKHPPNKRKKAAILGDGGVGMNNKIIDSHFPTRPFFQKQSDSDGYVAGRWRPIAGAVRGFLSGLEVQCDER